MPEQKELSGTRKAAILVLTLEQNVAADIAMGGADALVGSIARK